MKMSEAAVRGAIAAAGMVTFAAMASCGKSPAAPGPATTLTLSSTASLDGWIQSNGTVVADGGGPLVGDFELQKPGVGYRQFYSFDLSTLPAGATIVSATLRLYQVSAVGAPFTLLGNVLVDHVNVGTSLDAADYNAVALTSNLGILSNAGTAGYKTLNVLVAVQADRAANRTRAQFRLRMSLLDSNNDGKNDYVTFTDFEDSCCAVNQPPQLVIEYTN